MSISFSARRQANPRTGIDRCSALASASHLEITSKGPLVLLFFDGLEFQAYSEFRRRVYSDLRAFARATWRVARGKAPKGGFYLAFESLRDSLQLLGCDVRVNDFAAARARPRYPIGIAGHPSVLERVQLPNPAIFGPGDPGYPDEAGAVAQRPSIRRIIQPSQWYVDFYRPYCGDKMMVWPAGIDTQRLPDTSKFQKDIDVLIYDKIRWDHDDVYNSVIEPLKSRLVASGLSYEIIRYGYYRPKDLAAYLKRAKTMAFICEHETQGLACEQAMAANVPIFAWDEGRLADPKQIPFVKSDLRVSSVPYFDDRCGVRFTRADMTESFDRFWKSRERFKPRDYIEDALSMEKCGLSYLEAYNAIAGEQAAR
ncbi:MAG TPA: glycosyltransferase family 1 protein [Hyphomicrobium sp.]|nr:glycosyltransferase family 1 protein [Hyphomicrobium sp.]